MRQVAETAGSNRPIRLALYISSKKEGFGQFTVTALVLLVAVSLTAILAAAGKIAEDNTTSILLAVIGFSSGLALRTKDS